MLQPLIYLLSRHLHGPAPDVEGASPASRRGNAEEQVRTERDSETAGRLQEPAGLKPNAAKQRREAATALRRQTPRRRRAPGLLRHGGSSRRRGGLHKVIFVSFIRSFNKYFYNT